MNIDDQVRDQARRQVTVQSYDQALKQVWVKVYNQVQSQVWGQLEVDNERR